ncbi:MAG: hypothetical protein NW204_06310 [Xanthomonadaceae bacterium]|nr:hypothetical protein [Xanthomonadaceae bacterium]
MNARAIIFSVFLLTISSGCSQLGGVVSFPRADDSYLGCPKDIDEAKEVGAINVDAAQVAGSRRLININAKNIDTAMPIIATRHEDYLWGAECPVFLNPIYNNEKRTNGLCAPRNVFMNNSKITLDHVGDGRYRLVISHAVVVRSGRRQKIDYVRQMKAEHNPHNENEYVWLKSKKKLFSNMDFYVFLPDMRLFSDGLEGGFPKYYVIEAFDRSDSGCKSHLPSKDTLCAVNDSRPVCGKFSSSDSNSSNRGLVKIRTLQTDTGGGHEPPIKDK